MIEAIVTCDRCGRVGGDGKSLGLGLSITNPARLHLCTQCVEAFHAWCAEAKPKEKAA